jgi:uncharacterized protein YbaR (Trm112 family)
MSLTRDREEADAGKTQRMSVPEQIRQGRLVCPTTHGRLRIQSQQLVCDTGMAYNLHGKVPILLQDVEWANAYIESAPGMLGEYQAAGAVESPRTMAERLKERLRRLAYGVAGGLRHGHRDYRTERSQTAFISLFDNVAQDSLCLSIGGGPGRPHPSLVNLNIGPFPNVEVVGDAHSLPYADGSVDAIYCEAVLEHLTDPDRAVAEMFRVCRPGGQVYANSPFIAAYHGYPNHFQNFTLTGHVHLFASAGFQIRESGPAVGPVFTMLDLFGKFLWEYSPRPLRWPTKAAWLIVWYLVLPLDRFVNIRDNAYVLASTTYLVAEKPVTNPAL